MTKKATVRRAVKKPVAEPRRPFLVVLVHTLSRHESREQASAAMAKAKGIASDDVMFVMEENPKMEKR